MPVEDQCAHHPAGDDDRQMPPLHISDEQAGSDGRAHAGKRYHLEEHQQDQKDDQRHDQIPGVVKGEDAGGQQKAKHRGDCLASFEMGKDRIAVSDRRGQPGPDRNAGTDQCAECDGDDDLQDVAGDDRGTGLGAEHPSCVRSSEVATSIIANIRLIEYLADHQGEGNRSQQVTDDQTGQRRQRKKVIHRNSPLCIVKSRSYFSIVRSSWKEFFKWELRQSVHPIAALSENAAILLHRKRFFVIIC